MNVPRLYPVFLDLSGRHVLVVGGGTVALRKARGLLEAGARVTLVAPVFASEFAGMRLRKICGHYVSAHMRTQQWSLVFAATDSSVVNARVYKDAARRRILCCRCDDAEGGKRSDFAGAAVARAGPVTLAVSSAGASPALCVRIRDQAAGAIDPAIVRLAELLVPWRVRVKRSVANLRLRRKLLQELSGPLMEETLRKQGPRQARELFVRLLREVRSADSTSPGEPPAEPGADKKDKPSTEPGVGKCSLTVASRIISDNRMKKHA
ncbi:MAG: bifunctional precorrin-2 dehydrogenase/sirohydrochlorin ferrochelatase [Phycisphaerales bacterium]|nr:bifunctional precorrin-2 dehydrogenase/sirohydrochlorin ferrochelatase [Phycisphaerales bacterium]